jgi:uncharacterized membrane protein
MPKALLILVGTQLVYSVSDFMGRIYMHRHGFRMATFLTFWFFIYLVLRQLAMFGQLYVFAHVELGRTMALMGASSIVISNILGLLFLKEMLTPVAYIGVTLAVISFFVMAAR